MLCSRRADAGPGPQARPGYKRACARQTTADCSRGHHRRGKRRQARHRGRRAAGQGDGAQGERAFRQLPFPALYDAACSCTRVRGNSSHASQQLHASSSSWLQHQRPAELPAPISTAHGSALATQPTIFRNTTDRRSATAPRARSTRLPSSARSTTPCAWARSWCPAPSAAHTRTASARPTTRRLGTTTRRRRRRMRARWRRSARPACCCSQRQVRAGRLERRRRCVRVTGQRCIQQTRNKNKHVGTKH